MKNQDGAGHAAYQDARKSFETLELSEKTTFLIEATFTTAAAAIHEIGRHLKDIVDNISTQEAEEEAAEEEAAEPEPKPKTTSTKRRSSSRKKKED